MSGHSKWSTIKRAKGVTDAKKGAVFTKLANAVIVAAKNGGGNPDNNFSLKIAIDKAKALSMPKENIERAIKRGTGELGGAAFEEVLYEAIAPHNIGILIEAATDNRNRTTAEVKNALAKFGAKFASSGAVSYQFNKMGKLLVDMTSKNREEVELAAIDAGAEDFDEHGEDLAIFTAPQNLEKVKKSLEENNLTVKEAVLSWEPKMTVKIEDKEMADKIIALMQALDDLDDISNVYANFEIN